MVRFKNRYLLAEFIFPSDLVAPGKVSSAPKFNEANLVAILREGIQVNFGDIGAAQVGSALHVKYLSPHTHIAIIRTSRLAVTIVWQAITFLRQIKGVDCSPRVLHVGGTIRKTQQCAIRYDRMIIMNEVRLKSTCIQDSDIDQHLEESQKAIMGIDP